MASYSLEHELEECKVWDNGEFKTHESVPVNQRDTLYLFDGIPNKLPKHESYVTVCFASPDIEWFIKMNKHGSLYREMYMPNWTSKEIRNANNELQLNFSDKILDQRWQYFGGTVRCRDSRPANHQCQNSNQQNEIHRRRAPLL